MPGSGRHAERQFWTCGGACDGVGTRCCMFLYGVLVDGRGRSPEVSKKGELIANVPGARWRERTRVGQVGHVGQVQQVHGV